MALLSPDPSRSEQMVVAISAVILLTFDIMR